MSFGIENLEICKEIDLGELGYHYLFGVGCFYWDWLSGGALYELLCLIFNSHWPRPMTFLVLHLPLIMRYFFERFNHDVFFVTISHDIFEI